ncbi:hypothetical protein [Microbacterium sp. 1P06AB]|uniref:hypothetical protein n=1 Tax=Microbacterium sp. 1P06AB TaxID=3132289 RepID=UPI0039A3FFD9
MSPSALVRSWPTLAAWGAGLLQLGLGAGAITKGADVAARGVGVLLVTVGASALIWGAVALTKGRLVAPRGAMIIGLAGIAATTTVLLVNPVQMSAYPVAVALALSLVVGVTAAVAVRRSARREPSAARTAARTSVWGLVVGAFLLSGIVTPALAATPVGSDAPGANVNEVFMPGHGGH